MGKSFEDVVEELETAQDQRKVLDVINEAGQDPESAKNMVELLEEGNLESAEPQTDTPTDTSNIDQKEETTNVDEPKTETKDKEILPNKAPNESQPFVIDDAYIEKADGKDKHILETLKGETMSQKALDRLLNAQRKIGEQGQELGDLRKKQTEITTAIPQEIPKQKDLTEQSIQTAINQEIDKLLKSQFPDMPDDPIEREDYLESLTRSKWDAYRDAKNRYTSQVENSVNKAMYIISHRDEINQTNLNNDIIRISDKMAKRGIKDLAALGFDLTFTADTNGKQTNKFLTPLMFLPDGRPDPEVMEYQGVDSQNNPVFLYKERSLYNKFLDAYDDKIYQAAMTQQMANTRKETIENADKLKEKAINTATNPKGGKIEKGDEFDITNPKHIEKFGNTPEKARDIVKKFEEELQV